MIPSEDLIEIPFENRYQCWFCGEPSAEVFSYPNSKELNLNNLHQRLSVPCCAECRSFALKTHELSIFSVKSKVKRQLIHRYRKHLAIGINWTKKELEESEFEGGNFEGFKRSAWFMFEVAQQRVNFNGWPIVVDGIPVQPKAGQDVFIFDGVEFVDIGQAIEHYCHAFALERKFFQSVLYLLGTENFSKAVRICRLNIAATPNEKKQVLMSIAQ